MEYIRTKKLNGIQTINNTSSPYFNLVSKEEFSKIKEKGEVGKPVSYIEDGVWYFYYNLISGPVWMVEQILRQSDNLAELIDEFVIVRDNSDVHQLVRTDRLEYLKILVNHDTHITGVYGAIWMNPLDHKPILESVAKLNDKGDLELL